MLKVTALVRSGIHNGLVLINNNMAVFSTNLTIYTVTDFEQTFLLEDSNSNSALNLTGFTGACRMQKISIIRIADLLMFIHK